MKKTWVVVLIIFLACMVAIVRWAILVGKWLLIPYLFICLYLAFLMLFIPAHCVIEDFTDGPREKPTERIPLKEKIIVLLAIAGALVLLLVIVAVHAIPIIFSHPLVWPVAIAIALSDIVSIVVLELWVRCMLW